MSATLPQYGTTEQEEPTPPANSPLSVFLVISAKAYSSIGFSLSVLAIWIRWFLPGADPSASTIQIKVPGHPPRSKMRSLPKPSRVSVPPPIPTRRSSAPPLNQQPPPAPILGPSPDRPGSSHRRVYFADMPVAVVRRNTAPLERYEPAHEEMYQSGPAPMTVMLPISTQSPPSSAASMTDARATTPVTTQDILPTTREHDIDAESCKASTMPTSTPRQHKLRLSFNLKHKRNATPDKYRDEIPVQENVTKPAKKGAHPLMPIWTNSRKGGVSSENQAATPPVRDNGGASKASSSILLGCQKSSSSSTKSSSSSSSIGSLPSILHKKAQRRVSAPVPRTSPYEAPYFATPPLILDDAYSTYLRKLPQFEDDMVSRSSKSSRVSATPKERPTSSSGVPQTAVQRPVVKRRSASVNWEMRRNPDIIQ